MATPILTAVSKNFAEKIQDPVTAGTDDGIRLTANRRIYYILQGYRQLLRFVTLLYPQLITKIFTKYYTIDEVSTGNTGLLTASSYAEVYQIYAKEPDDEKYVKADKIEPNLFQDVKEGTNRFYTPDLNTKKYFWSILDGNIQVIPPTKFNLKISNRKNTASLVEANGYNGEYDLDIPMDYSDLILNLSAAEAYLDLGQPELSGAFQKKAENELQILAEDKKEKVKKETTNET